MPPEPPAAPLREAPPEEAAPEPTEPAATPAKQSMRTRISSTYVGVWAGIVVLVLVLIFIIQNLNDASVHYLGLNFSLPVGILILIGVVAGGVIVALASLARVAQLRLRARRTEGRRPDGRGPH